MPIRVVAAVVEREGRLLVCERPAHKRHGGLWEFPGGKVEAGESDFDAVARELREELGVEVTAVGAKMFAASDPGSAYQVEFFPVEITGEPRALEHTRILWADPCALRTLPLAPSDLRFARCHGVSGRVAGNVCLADVQGPE